MATKKPTPKKKKPTFNGTEGVARAAAKGNKFAQAEMKRLAAAAAKRSAAGRRTATKRTTVKVTTRKKAI